MLVSLNLNVQRGEERKGKQRMYGADREAEEAEDGW